MFSILTLLSNISNYKQYIIIGGILLLILSSFLYVKHLKDSIISEQNINIELKKTIQELHDTNIKNSVVYKLNESTLNTTIKELTDSINTYKINEKLSISKFNSELINIRKYYDNKVILVKDSNSTPKIECNTLADIIDEELK